MRLLALPTIAILSFVTPSLAQDANPVLPLFNVVGTLLEQKMQEEALKNSPEYPQPGGLTRGQVIIVQQKLIERGYDIGDADGIIGPKTMAVVGTLQQRSGRPVTGLPDPDLLQALLR